MAITYGASFGDWYYHEEGEASEAFTLVAALLLGVGGPSCWGCST